MSDLIAHPYEEEWFEFKVNWFEHKTLGEYIFALSNAAVLQGKDSAYFVGIENNTHKEAGTKFDFHRDEKNEPLQYYLARLVRPDIGFKFDETDFSGQYFEVWRFD